jgi:SAM-dependent methyltransferase
MHPSALNLGNEFFRTYGSEGSKEKLVIDLGSQDIVGSLRSVCSPSFKYLGVDFQAGENVDLILNNPYQLPFDDNSIDIIVCSSVFEHSQFFWKLYLEILRVLKPEGIFYLNAPSNGYIHRYPVDCWRFYPDAGIALVEWGKENGFSPALLESFIADKHDLKNDEDWWNDYIAVFIKDASKSAIYANRILHSFDRYSNAYCDDLLVDRNVDFYPSDYKLQKQIEIELSETVEAIEARDAQISHLESHAMDAREIIKAQNIEVSRLASLAIESSETIKARNIQISHLESLARDAGENLKMKDVKISELESIIGHLSHEINLITNSRSWRLTKPLRILKRFFK